MLIKRCNARLIKNSRRENAIEVKLKTDLGKFYCSSPSGKSKGKYEVQDFNEKGVKHSVKLANLFLKKFEKSSFMLKNFDDLKILEEELKIFEKKHEKLGGNVYYAIEGVFLKAAAKEQNKELWEFILKNNKPKIPMPVGNCIGGGLHTRTHHKKPDFQEFLFIPDENSFSKAVSKNILAYLDAKFKIRLRERKLIIKTNDENAIITSLTNQEVLEIMRDVAKKFNLRIGIDVAASSFYDGKEFYDYKNKRFLRTREEQLKYLLNLINEFDLFYVEDPFHEEDFLSFRNLLSKLKDLKKDTLIVGDDLTTTNLERVMKAVRLKAINALIVKPNQIGSLIEVKKVVEFCKKNGIKIIFSHRSGETLDNILADYAIGFGADFIKTGIIGQERLIKLRRIIDIEKKINAKSSN